jgi:hypothetical protein
MKHQNPYKTGDWVIILDDIRDSYEEIWHHAGDRLKIKSIHNDGQGLMFESDLGIRWTRVKRSLNSKNKANSPCRLNG